jgi:predicted pyridoxine 5'-phosphate oxidase superfamily flavin-nucleotide-binding protein
MSHRYHALAFTDAVLAAQARYGSRAAVERYHRAHDAPLPLRPVAGVRAPTPEARPGTGDALTGLERQFLAELDGFYLATVSETGWPYVQFRGGPAGFIHTPDEHTIAWADFRGNRQYISMGNLALEGRAALIFMDYARQTRLKVYGWASVNDIPTPHPGSRGRPDTGAAHTRPHDPATGGTSLAVPGYPGRVEREVRVDVTAYDWNCPQHITPRYTVDELAPQLDPILNRVTELEEKNRILRIEIGRLRGRRSKPSPEGAEAT